VKVLLFANTDWYLFNFRRSLAAAVRAAGHEVILVSPEGPYGPRLEQMGFRWIPAPMQRRSLDPRREWSLVWWLRGLLVRERVDLIHGFTIKCAVYGSIAGRLAGVPGRVGAVAGMGYVFTSNTPLALALRPVVRCLLRFALGGPGARLILQNPDDVALFRHARLVDPARIRMIPGSGVDCARFAPAAEEASASPGAGRPFRILLPARLLWDKGIAEFVEASRLLRAEGAQVDFLLAGEPDEGNPGSVPQQVLQQWVREGLVTWLGHVSDMPALLKTVDAVVLPSYREGLPKGLVEAAAAGLALVTTDAPGCREVVTDAVDGLLVPARDALALARAIRTLHDDRALCRRFGAAARQKALQRFDECIVLQQTLRVYEELTP
jgi:glycosyltransferase involved in cell wall biosynthesis